MKWYWGMIIWIGLSNYLALVAFTVMVFSIKTLESLNLLNWQSRATLILFALTHCALDLYLLYRLVFKNMEDK